MGRRGSTGRTDALPATVAKAAATWSPTAALPSPGSAALTAAGTTALPLALATTLHLTVPLASGTTALPPTAAAPSLCLHHGILL